MPKESTFLNPMRVAIRRPVHVCPSCLGVTGEISMFECPECGIELLARVPLSDRHCSAPPRSLVASLAASAG